jgi:precorrin-6x reductase
VVIYFTSLSASQRSIIRVSAEDGSINILKGTGDGQGICREFQANPTKISSAITGVPTKPRTRYCHYTSLTRLCHAVSYELLEGSK